MMEITFTGCLPLPACRSHTPRLKLPPGDQKNVPARVRLATLRLLLLRHWVLSGLMRRCDNIRLNHPLLRFPYASSLALACGATYSPLLMYPLPYSQRSNPVKFRVVPVAAPLTNSCPKFWSLL